jgi:uncharacterized protein (TIGR00251 family)
MIIDVLAAPNSKRFSIAVKEGRIRISLKSAPENNKANIELIKELASLTRAPVRILSGHTTKRKKIEIALSEKEWKEFLSDLLSA